jgi:exosortase/archaeosortase family protein
VAVVGLVMLAYNYSLMTLARGLGLQTPLAYLALVPIIAIAIAAARLRIEPKGLPIHDRQLDWIVGLGLIGIAAAVLILMPDPTSSAFWLRRVDLLTLPLFVAGLVTLLFGIRRAWSLKAPIAFLLLAWPVPYTLFSGAIGQFTELTAHLVAAITRIVPVARPTAADDTLFIVGSGANAFSVSVGAACAGVNSLVGFLLIGVAMLLVVRGPVIRRGLWLALGLAVIFTLNVVRIFAILAVGASLGQAAAFEVLHPFAGLLVFNVGVIAMVILAPHFGLRFIGPSDRTSHEEQAPEPRPVRRARSALLVGLSVAVVLGITNAAYSRFEAISSGLGDARLGSFDVRESRLAGWESKYISAFPQAKQYFGSTATWDRVSYWSGAEATLTSTRSVYLDVITTDDPGALADYSLQACYRFHGYDIASVTTADIGAGVQAQIIDYVNTQVDADWSALWWEWPYSENGQTRYARVVILMGEGPKTEFTGVAASDVNTQAPRFVQSDRFLVTLGRAIVRSQLETA